MSVSTRHLFEQILVERGMIDDGSILTDAILVAAIEGFDGTTVYCRVFPDGEQSHHRSVGLLKVALDELDRLSREDDE